MAQVSRISVDEEPDVGLAVATAFVAAVDQGLSAAPSLWSMPVLAGVSGGADSLALLLALRRLVPAGLERRLVVLHAEHDLRPSAPDDRQFVADVAAQLGLALVWKRLAVREGDGGEGVEARARRLRYAWFADVAGDLGGRHVLVAHTADDQAETILQRMLRGTGLAGVGGMAAARELVPGVSLLRPLLGVRRSAPRRFLDALGQPWREDATNADRTRSRNFVRHELLAPCEAGPFPAATESLVRLGHHAAAMAAALRSAAEQLLEHVGSRTAEGGIALRTRDLATLDPHLVAEVFVAAWHREGWPQRDMTALHYQALASLAMGGGSPTTFPGSIQAIPTLDGRLVLRRDTGPAVSDRQDDISTRR